MKKIDQIEEANVGIAIATASIDDEEMVHFLPQKSRSKFEDRSAKIKRAGYKTNLYVFLFEKPIKSEPPGKLFQTSKVFETMEVELSWTYTLLQKELNTNYCAFR